MENLVPAMFGICLREHHELGIGGVAIQPGVTLNQVVDLLTGKRQAKIRIRLHEGLAATFREIDGRQWRRLVRFEKRNRFIAAIKQSFGHAIKQHRTQRCKLVVANLAGNLDAVADAALDALDHVEVARQRNIRRFTRPGRNRAGTRHDVDCSRAFAKLAWLVAGQQQTIQPLLLLCS